MTNYKAYFTLHTGGVTLVLSLNHESKHHPLSSLDAACENIARRLDATFLYYEKTV